MLLQFLQGSFDFPAFLRNFLLSLPAFIIALSMHEAAHGYVADRCGDPTARMMGRVTLNPLKHLDPMGFLCMLIAGVGWAKPVPVNPRNFKNPRKDDILVSVAGVSMNLLLFLLSCVVLYGMLGFALAHVPDSARTADGAIRVTLSGVRYGYTVKDAFLMATDMSEYLFTPFFGRAAGYVYEVFVNLALVNLVLAVFNLLPIPPLDGYHVLNDLVLKKSLFAPRRAMQIGQAAILILAVTGLLSKGLGYVMGYSFYGVGEAFYALFTSLHIV